MSTINSNYSLTLDGSTDFNIDGDSYVWNDNGFLIGVDIYSEADPSPTATVTLTGGTDWSISTLRFINTVTAELIDQTDVGEAFFNHIRFGGLGAHAVFTNASANNIEGSGAVENLTLGSGWFGSLNLFGGDDEVTAGSGDLESANLGDGNNKFTGGSGWIGSVIAYGGNDTFVGGSNGVGAVNLGSGNNTITAGDSSLDAVIAYDGNDTYVGGSNYAGSINLGSGTNNITTGTGSTDSIVAYSGDDTFTGGAGDVGSVILGNGANVINTGTGWTGSVITYDGADTVTTSTGGVSYVGTGGGNDVVTIGRGGIEHLALGQGNDIVNIGPLNDADNLVIINGGLGTDSASFASFTSGVTVNMHLGPDIDTAAGNFMFVSIENVTGSKFNDNITGNSAANVFNGGEGIDRINGGKGNDTISLGLGKDVLVFNTAPSTSANHDYISDFRPVDDMIQLENSIFTKLAYTGGLKAANFVRDATGVAHDANDYIIYETDTGKLFYDANGSASGGSQLIATFTNKAALTVGDFFLI